jgi:adenylate cyclase
MGRFIKELRRRNVLRVTGVFLGVSWLLFEVVSGVKEAAGLPEWADSVALIVLIIALPVFLVWAWFFDVTPEGIKRTPPADPIGDAPPNHLVDFGVLAAIFVFAGLIAWQQVNRLANLPPASGDIVNVVTPANATPGEDGQVRTGVPISVDGNQPSDLSVAVLPFLAMTAEDTDRFFADGLTEEILNSLAAVPELLVTSRTSAFQFRGDDLPSIPEIAGSLGVAHILEGSVRRSGDQVRITAQLIRASDDRHLWSQTYDRSLEDVFQIQEDIAENVAAVLKVVLDEENRLRMTYTGTRNFDAYIAFQEAKALWDRAHEEDENDLLERADAIFATALELAPDYSEAWLLRSDWYGHQLAELSVQTPVDMEAIERAAAQQTEFLNRAYDTADSNSRRDIIEANLIFFSEDWRNARAVLNEALAADECANDNWLQVFSILYDDMDRRLAYARQQVECDPLNEVMLLLLGDTYLARGEYVEAHGVATTLNELNFLFEAETIGFEALLGAGLREEAEVMLQPDWEWEEIRFVARFGTPEAVRAHLEPFLSEDNSWFDLVIAALMGETEWANEIAAAIDARPYPVLALSDAIANCRCGAPFDLESTPNFSARIAESGISWPPAGDLGFPRGAIQPDDVIEN